MKIKTSELSGAALDWAVLFARNPGVANLFSVTHCLPAPFSTDWALAGPIIEEEGIDVHRVTSALWSASWWANNSGMAKNPAQRFKHNVRTDGPTPLVAAMRCYVASKLGDEVDVPDELTQGEAA